MIAAMYFIEITGLKWLSILACTLILVGYSQRRRKRVHIPVMLTALVIDLTIVVCIEVTRDVIASAQAKMGTLMKIHIAISVTVLVLYGVQVWTGIQKARGRYKPWHGRTGVTFILFRLGNLVTSFMVS